MCGQNDLDLVIGVGAEALFDAACFDARAPIRFEELRFDADFLHIKQGV